MSCISSLISLLFPFKNTLLPSIVSFLISVSATIVPSLPSVPPGTNESKIDGVAAR